MDTLCTPLRDTNLECFLIVFKILSPRPPPYPILWPTLTQYGLTIVRVVIGQSTHVTDFLFQFLKKSISKLSNDYILQNNPGGFVGVATRAVFKPTSYLTVCTILQVTFTTNFRNKLPKLTFTTNFRKKLSPKTCSSNFYKNLLQQTFTKNLYSKLSQHSSVT